MTVKDTETLVERALKEANIRIIHDDDDQDFDIDAARFGEELKNADTEEIFRELEGDEK